MPMINFAAFGQAGDYAQRWTNANLGGVALSVLQVTNNLKVESSQGRDFLKGIEFQNGNGEVVIDLNLDTRGKYLHINIYGSSGTSIPKKAASSAGSKAKGCIYCIMERLEANRIKLSHSPKDHVGEKLVNVDSCDHPKKSEILNDVGILLFHTFQGCIEQ